MLRADCRQEGPLRLRGLTAQAEDARTGADDSDGRMILGGIVTTI
jgi:hypothetical protein